MKIGYSDPMILSGKDYRSTDKRYARDVRPMVIIWSKVRVFRLNSLKVFVFTFLLLGILYK